MGMKANVIPQLGSFLHTLRLANKHLCQAVSFLGYRVGSSSHGDWKVAEVGGGCVVRSGTAAVLGIRQ